ncbi:MAG TPA: phosphatidylinositol kinase, partial [Accumulibacter sp.]|nr:phosphatidylinositol kinase [Accumulibacter sp.]
AAAIHSVVPEDTWRRAEELALAFLARIDTADGFSARFGVCLDALRQHLATTGAKIRRLG